MFCNGLCGICGRCYIGEIKNENAKNVKNLRISDSQPQNNGVEISPSISTELQNEAKLNEVAVIESVGTYEVTKNIFGKEKVRKVK